MLKKIVATIGITLFISGCVGVNPVSNEAVSSQRIAQSSVMDVIDEADKDSLKKSDEQELYFADTHNKIFYSQSGANTLDFHVKVLLRSLFAQARHKLPRVSRRKKLNVALEVGDKKLLKAAQSFIISSRRYNLANTDRNTMKILRKVLKEEKDSIYKGRSKIRAKSKSDVILYINSSKDKEKITISAELIAKNGTILGRVSNNIYTDDAKNKQEWVEVLVPRNDGPAQAFEVMRNAVTMKEYYGNGDNTSVSDISFSEANDFCQRVMKAEIVSPYVFENARKSLSISRPTSPVNSEMIAPYDDEDDEDYYVDGDKLEAADGTIILFNWNSEKYFAVSNIYHSKNTTFRCMRAK